MTELPRKGEVWAFDPGDDLFYSVYVIMRELELCVVQPSDATLYESDGVLLHDATDEAYITRCYFRTGDARWRRCS